jgi:uncharacterized protein YdeI (YjbR/CyaY-like superfamily)
MTTTDSEPKIPTDFRKALAASLKAKSQWNSLTPIARRDFISWIDSAKQLETRTRRIERACDMLAKGKRRPCCYAIVPMDLYRALGNDPRAKARWSALSPLERRGFASSIDSAKQSDVRKERIKKVIAMLASGKRLFDIQ